MKKLYHGSERVIEQPLFGHGKPYNDYGLGFYCTESSDMAKEWGVGRNRDGYVNGYELDWEGLSILDLNAPQYCILHWLTILLQNREFDMSSALAREGREYLTDCFKLPYWEYDILVGYRADDSYFSFAQDFLNGTISFLQLNQAMYLGKLGQQVVLKSENAFDRIHFTGYEIAASEEWYAKRMLRDQKARREYFDIGNSRRERGDIYITQILDEEMKSDDARLR